jgi:16S rRNA (guanine527-N7)-methyltransferase
MPEPDHPPLTPLVTRGCARLGIDLPPEAAARLCAYADEAIHWGRRINLSGAKDARAFLSQHVLDGLSAFPALAIQPGESWADVGSGVGVPGIPLAILTPGTSWTVVEPRAKRASFLLHVCHRLSLDNVTVLTSRIDAAPVRAASLDGVVSRALGAPSFDAWPWLKPGGRLCLYAGPEPGPLDTPPEGLPLTPEAPVTVTIPDQPGTRRLLVFRRTAA